MKDESKMKISNIIIVLMLLIVTSCTVYRPQQGIIELPNDGDMVSMTKKCYQAALDKCHEDHPFSCQGIRYTPELTCNNKTCLCT